MPTVDDILGPAPKPTTDQILGPPPAPSATGPDFESVLNQSSIGRVLDAFGQGMKEGWGSGPLGLSDQSTQALRNAGIFKQADETSRLPFKAFNEGLIRPAAAGLDAFFRGGTALYTGAVRALQQGAVEEGAPPEEAARLARDVKGLPEAFAGHAGGVNIPLAEDLGVLRDTSERPAVAPTRVETVPEKVAQGEPAAVPGEKLAPTQAAPPATEPQSAAAPITPTQIFDKSGDATAAVDKAGNINLDRIQAGSDVKDLISDVAEQNGGFTDARRGEIPLSETEQMAQALGMEPADLVQRKAGQAFNAEEAVAARQLLVQSASSVHDLASKAAASGSDADLLAFQEAATKHQAIQEQVAGMTAEAGRALSSFRVKVGEAQDVGAILDAAQGGRKGVADTAKLIDSLDTPQAVSKFLMDQRKPSYLDMAKEFWMNALLSGPATHATYALSNVATAMLRVPETMTAAAIGKVRTILPGAPESRVYIGEAGTEMMGLVQGAKEGITAGWQAFKTGMPTHASALPVQRQAAIPGIAGEIVRGPSRAVHALGEFYYSIGYRQELNKQAFRTAADEGLEGSAFTARQAQLLSDPTPEMMDAAKANGEYQNFTQQLGKSGRAITSAIDAMPAGRFVLPFIKVPANIVKYAGERSPLGLLMSDVRENLSGANGAAAQDTQMARMAVGTAVGAATMYYASNGNITGGGPSNPAERNALMLTGWRPYSVKIGDTYYGYHRFGSWGLLMGMAADWSEIHEHATKDENFNIAGALLGSTAKNLTNMSWLQGPAQLIQAIEDPDRYGDKYVQSLAASFAVPTGLAQIAHYEDPVIRDARTTLDAIKSRIPGLSQTLLPKRDIWGEPLTRGDTVGGLASAITESRVNNDPVNLALNRLGLWPAKLQEQIRGVKLNPDQYDEYQRTAGRLAKNAADQLVGMPGFNNLPDFAQKEMLKNSIEKSRKTGRTLMLMRHPKIIQQATDARVQQITGQKPAAK